MKVFVYGTLKRGQPNHILLEGGKFCGSVVFAGYSIYEIPGNHFPIAAKDSEGVIFGELFEIDEEILKNLDIMEGFYGDGNPDNLFNRVKIIINDSPVFVYVFALDLPSTARKISIWK